MDHLHRMYVAMIKPRKKWLIVGLAMVLIFILTAIIVPITIYALNDANSSESQVTSTIPTTPPIATNTTTPITTMTTPTTSQVTSTMPTTLTSTATPITTLTTPTTTQITSTIPTTLTSTIVITMTTQTTTQVASTMPTTLTTKTAPITTLTTPTTTQVTSTTLTIPTAITTWPIPTTTSDKPSKKRGMHCHQNTLFTVIKSITFFVAIIVVATGIGENNTYVTSTEIIDFNNPSESCTPWADSFDFKVGSAVGGFFDNGLVICSAVPTQESEATTSGCFVVNQTVASPFSTELKYAFTGASGVMVDRENFLITGGYNGK